MFHFLAQLALVLLPFLLLVWFLTSPAMPRIKAIRYAWAALIGVALLLVPHVAFAATAAAPTTVHFFSADVVNALGEFTAAIILAIGAAVWKWLDANSPLKNTQAEAIAREAFSNLLDKAATFGQSQAESGLTKVGDVDVHDPRIAAGANFIIGHAPDLAKSMGIDVMSPEGQAAIIRSVTLRVAQALGDNTGQTTNVVTPLTLPSNVTLASTPTQSQPGVASALNTSGAEIPPAKNQ